MRYGVMVALQILVLSVQVRILVSQHKSRKLSDFNNLRDLDLTNGTDPGQHFFSLYDALTELCKEKKMHLFKPTLFSDYRPAELHEGKIWYISFYVKDPNTGNLKRVRIKWNQIESIIERRRSGKQYCKQINEKLALGWNPLKSKGPVHEDASIIEVMDSFLQSKEKETEYHTMRAYQSFIKIFKKWMDKNGVPENTSVSAMTHLGAVRFLEDINKRVKPSTYNNYLRFFNILSKWMIEHGYINSNPFENIKKKPKKLTKKNRTNLTDENLKTLWTFLEKENPGYLLVCLLCYCCLIRPKEISMLKCGDIDIEHSTIHISEDVAKNDNESYRTIPDVLMKKLLEVDLSHSDWYLFSGDVHNLKPGTKKIWSQRFSDYWGTVVREKCGFGQHLQLYSLKDTGITNMLASGMPASFVKQQADHSDLSMTSVYLGKTEKANEAIKHINVPGL